MRAQFFHCRFVEILLTEESNRSQIIEPVNKPSIRMENCLMVWFTVEINDTWKQITDLHHAVTEAMTDVGVNRVMVAPYVHLSEAEKVAGARLAFKLYKLLVKSLTADSHEVATASFGQHKELHWRTYGHPLSFKGRVFNG